jgi:hypothetical protein
MSGCILFGKMKTGIVSGLMNCLIRKFRWLCSGALHNFLHLTVENAGGGRQCEYIKLAWWLCSPRDTFDPFSAHSQSNVTFLASLFWRPTVSVALRVILILSPKCLTIILTEDPSITTCFNMGSSSSKASKSKYVTERSSLFSNNTSTISANPVQTGYSQPPKRVEQSLLRNRITQSEGVGARILMAIGGGGASRYPSYRYDKDGNPYIPGKEPIKVEK